MSIGLRPWISEVNNFMKQNNLESFMFYQLPDELKDKSMLQRASNKGYLRKIDKVQLKPPVRSTWGDRVSLWIIAKGV